MPVYAGRYEITVTKTSIIMSSLCSVGHYRSQSLSAYAACVVVFKRKKEKSVCVRVSFQQIEHDSLHMKRQMFVCGAYE